MGEANMAFPIINYASNELMKSPVNDIINNLFSGYGQAKQAKYLEPTLAEQLKKAQLENQYYGPNIESQMGLRGAQAGHLGKLSEKLGIEMPFVERQQRAQLEALQAQAQKARLMEMIREQMLGGGFPGQQNHPQPMPQQQGGGLPQGQGMMNMPQALPPMPNYAQPEQHHESQQGMGFNPDYAKAAIMGQFLGLGMPKVVDINGKQVAISPLGNFPTGLQGLTEEQKARESGFGKEDAKLYGQSTNAYSSYANQGVALEELANAAENNPQFRNVVGPIKQPLTNWFGSPQQQQLLGQLSTSSGEIALQVASALKGAWTGRDQSMVNDIKASPRDFPDVFIGKLKAQKLINDALQERSALVAQNLKQGMSSIDALRTASRATPLDRFRPQVEQLLKHKEILPFNQLEQAKQILAKREQEEHEKHKKRKKEKKND
jgi:hypothetical protein